MKVGGITEFVNVLTVPLFVSDGSGGGVGAHAGGSTYVQNGAIAKTSGEAYIADLQDSTIYGTYIKSIEMVCTQLPAVASGTGSVKIGLVANTANSIELNEDAKTGGSSAYADIINSGMSGGEEWVLGGYMNDGYTTKGRLSNELGTSKAKRYLYLTCTDGSGGGSSPNATFSAGSFTIIIRSYNLG